MIYIASDHAGVELKRQLIAHLQSKEFSISDEGTFSTDSVDYPDYAQKVANCIQTNPDSTGILICGTGIGMSISANRYPHIRAALCQSEIEAQLSRQHNNANVLCLGAHIITTKIAIACVDAFLSTSFEGGRHQSRVAKITPVNQLARVINLETEAVDFGFDWPNQDMAIEQAISECAEIKEAIHNGEPKKRVQEEISDLLHAVISLCLHSGFDVDQTLSLIVNKFGTRLASVKTLANIQGLDTLHGQSFDFMLNLWSEAKKEN